MKTFRSKKTFSDYDLAERKGYAMRYIESYDKGVLSSEDIRVLGGAILAAFEWGHGKCKEEEFTKEEENYFDLQVLYI